MSSGSEPTSTGGPPTRPLTAPWCSALESTAVPVDARAVKGLAVAIFRGHGAGG
jgi:hypothetical protein